jgi:hypothetical protein
MTTAKEAAVKVRNEDIESDGKKALGRLTSMTSVLARSIQGVRAVKDDLRLATAKG